MTSGAGGAGRLNPPATDERGAAGRRERIVLAFAGDLETTVAVPWLAETCGADVVTVTADFGQGRDLEEIRDRALAIGALRAHVLDAREEFARSYLLPAIRAGALADDRLPVAALGHAAVAATLVEIAGIEQSIRVAHGGVAAAPRIAAAVRALEPGFAVLAPVCESAMSRDQLIDYVAKRRLPMPASGFDALSMWPPVPGRAAPAADEAAVVDITFAAGVPVALNGVSMPLVDLIGSLEFLAGKNGVGRRGPFESPAVPVAHRDLQQRAGTGDVIDFSRTVSARYADLIARGGSFSVLRAALDAYVDRSEQTVNGLVRVKLYEGACEIVHGHIGVGHATQTGNVVPVS
jgi:argininosuccinate synthase